MNTEPAPGVRVFEACPVRYNIPLSSIKRVYTRDIETTGNTYEVTPADLDGFKAALGVEG